MGLHGTCVKYAWDVYMFSGASLHVGEAHRGCMRGSVWDLDRMPKGCVYRGMRMSMYGEGRGLSGAAALPPTTPIPATGHSLRHLGDSGLPSASPPPHPQSLARASVLAHLPRDIQIWSRGFTLINHLQLIVLSAKVV